MRCLRIRSLLSLTALAALAATGVKPLAGQVAEGISVGITPTVERVFFDDDLLFDDATYFGGRLGLNFGRHVGLQGYYLTVDALALDSLGPVESYRAGGDIVLTFSERQFTPFIRFGAGLMSFEDSVTNEILTGTVGGGLRFDLFDRFQTQVFVQDLIFRASDQSSFVDPAIADSVPDNVTFHNLTVGVGVNFYVGGRPRTTETDLFFEQGLRGVSIPLEVFGGEFRFDDDFGLSDETVVGARLGLDFGPYVGLQGYYFGGTGNDFDDFDDFYGYGLEGTFNLTPPNSSLTPFLVLGTGKLNFTPQQVTAAGFSDDSQWTATLGGGISINLDDRVQLEAGVRDILMSRDDPSDVTNPNQIKSSWLWTGGLRIGLGGTSGRGRPASPTVVPPPTPMPAAQTPPAGEPAGEPTPAAGAPAAGQAPAAAPAPAAPAGEAAVAGQAVVPGQVEAAATPTPESVQMRQRIEALEAEIRRLRDSTTAPGGETPGERLIQFPAPERGEIYVRYGEPGAFDRRGEPLPAGAAARTDTTPGAAAQAPAAAVVPGQPAVAPGAAQAGAAAQPAARSAEYDELLAALSSITARLDAMEAAGARSDSVRMAQALADVERQLRNLEDRPARQPTVIVPGQQPARQGDIVIVTEDARPRRGVLRGGGFNISQIGVHTGVSVADPEQALLGVRVDMGSAFGGAARFVPEATFGITGDGTFNLNTHIEWPLPLTVREFKTYLGAGVGFLAGREDAQGNSDLELLIPNLTFGVSRPVSRFEAYGAFQALDLFDDNRFIVGLRTNLGRPRGVASERAGRVTEWTDAPPQEVRPEAPPAAPQLTPEEEAERARLEAERRRLEGELSGIEEQIRERRALADEEARAAEREGEARAQAMAEAARRARLAEAHRTLLGRFQSLAVDVGSVSAVRQGDRGLVVELGGPGVFASGQAELSAGAQRDVRAVAQALVDYPDLRVSVEGHTDSTGGDAANQRLSERRADSVRRALEAYGIVPGRLSVAGFGETRPLVTNDTAVGRARNRRVEVIVLELRPAS